MQGSMGETLREGKKKNHRSWLELNLGSQLWAPISCESLDTFSEPQFFSFLKADVDPFLWKRDGLLGGLWSHLAF